MDRSASPKPTRTADCLSRPTQSRPSCQDFGARSASPRVAGACWRTGLAPVLLAGFAALGFGQTTSLDDAVRFWNQESEYSGAQSCRTCHLEIYARQEASNHARSLRQAGQVPELGASLPFSVVDRVSGFTLSLAAGSRGGVQLRAARGEEASRADLTWAFGSGTKGITPIGRTEGGAWVESRLTWYESLGAVSFTTGASQYDPKDSVESLGRALTSEEVAECFGCHTTGYDERASGPASDEAGIRCERCHGPGQPHVDAALGGRAIEGTIFDPGGLAGFAQIQMCGACHGTPPQDNDFDALALLERTPHSVRFPSQRIVLSRCFNESFAELACTTCHDPHLDVADEAANLDKPCLTCHDGQTRADGAVCPVSSTDCSSCHMPKRRVMRHSMFSDHWIRVVGPE